jgi:soluble lytic murein transglycosylase
MFKQLSVALFFIVTFFGCGSAVRTAFEITTASHNTLRAQVEQGEFTKAEQTLREWQRLRPAAFTRNNYDYLLAWLLEQRDQPAEAVKLFAQVAARNGVLTSYALWHQAEQARAIGRFNEEQTALQKLISQFPAFLRRERATLRLSESYGKTGNHAAAINTLRLLGPRRDTLPELGAAQMALKDAVAARASFESALRGERNDDVSLRAILQLDQLDAAENKLLTEAEHLRRARILQHNRAFDEARAHWLAVINLIPASRARPEAMFQAGRSYFLQDKFADARVWYERAGNEFPATEEGEQGFYYVGHCYQYLDQTDKAVARYESYFRQYPTGKFVGYGHLNAIDTLRHAGRLEEALQWCQRTQSLEPFFAVTGLFQQAKIRLSRNEYAAALADLNVLRTKNLNLRGQVATTNAAEVNFLRAYCLEQMGRLDEAITEYLAMPEGRNGASGYYGASATERLRGLSKNARAQGLLALRRDSFLTQARTAADVTTAPGVKAAANQALRLVNDDKTKDELLNILRQTYALLPGYQAPAFSFTAAGRTAPLTDGAALPAAGNAAIANELLCLGLAEEGAAVLVAANTASANTVSYYCSKGDCADYTFRLHEPALRALPEDYRFELLPRAFAEVAYPFPFRGELQQHARARGVDPRFVLSIARQESSYNPRVKSPAAARGMLQFIADTSNVIAAQLGLPDFAQDDLYEPHTAILFGAQYMKNLFDEFGSPQAVAAAYNGSEASVRRWLKRANHTYPNRLVAEVAKRETKEYVYRVCNHVRAYQALYP